MGKLKKKTFKFNKYESLGTADAETDSLLKSSFVDKGEYSALTNIDNPKSIVIGRTGSGKSALLQKIFEDEQKVIRIEPDSLSLKFLSNSTILEHLRKIDVNLHFFYKVLWKHVFIVEVIKLYLGEEGNKKQNLFTKLGQTIRVGSKADKARKKALEYFDNWSEEFWEHSEHRITNITKALEDNLRKELGADYKGLLANYSKTKINSQTESSEIKSKAESVISKLQAADLIKITDILSKDVFNNTQRKYFILIDDLDKEWVSQQVAYDLIGALIEVIKEFQQKFTGVKIIIALRENLHNIIFSGKQHRGGQREKITPLYLNLTWSSQELHQLIDNRLSELSGNKINLDEIFHNSKNKKASFNYIIERTYLRPRDLISFFNKIIEEANNKSHFNGGMVKRAEPSYSTERLQALEDEWYDNFGEINKVYKFLIGMNDGFNLKNVKEDPFAEILVEESSLSKLKGELYDIAHSWRNSKSSAANFKTFKCGVLFILYRIGIIGIKKDASTKTLFFYDKDANITLKDFNNDSKIYVHKSLYSALNINSKEQEVDFLK